MQETCVRSLGWEDPLEKEIPTPVFLPGEFHGEVVWYSHVFKNFPQFVVIQIIKGFSIVSSRYRSRCRNSRSICFSGTLLLYLWSNGCWQLISGSSVFSKSSLNIWEFLVQVLLKPSLENFEHYFASMWNECNCAVVWTFFNTAILWDWNENWPFPVLWRLLRFPNLLLTLSAAL